MKRKRLLFISNLFPNPACPNMATFNRQQVASLSLFYDIDVIAPISWLEKIKHPSIPSHRLEDGLSIHHPTYYYLPRYCRSWQGQAYHLSIRSIARKIILQRGCDVIFATWLFPDAWAAEKIASEFGLPLFIKVHGTDVNRLGDDEVSRKALAVVDKAERVICVSRALKNRLVQLGAPAERITVLHNGVDRRIFHAMPQEEVRARLGIGQTEKIILFVGNLKKEKGLRELLLAFHAIVRKTSELRLVIIGAGPYESTLRKLISKLQLSGSVSLLGGLPMSAIASWMNAATVFCLPSYTEGAPNVLLEALSCGTHIVASNVGGIPEFANGHQLLELIPPKSIEPLAEALARSLANGNRNGGAVAVSSWEENADKLHSMFSNAAC